MWPISIFTAKLPEMEDDFWESKIYGKKEEGLKEPVARSQCIDVPHVRQLSNWDCGLACVLMVLQTLGFGDRFDCYAQTTNVYLPKIYGRHLDYIGHFILICGYDSKKREFDIRDPASSRKHERISLHCLDEARKSFGTDEDILLISLNRQDGTKDQLRRKLEEKWV